MTSASYTATAQRESPAHRPEPRVRHGQRRHYSPTERAVIAAITIAAAAGAAAAKGAPTGHDMVDLVERALFAAGLAVLTSRARRWTWLVLAAPAAALGADAGLAAGGGAMLGAVAAAALPRRSHLLGAAVGGLAANAMLRAHHVGFFGANTLLFGTVIGVVAFSAYRNSRRAARRRARRVLVGLAAFGLAATCLAAVATLTSASPVRGSAELALDGVDAATEGDASSADDLLARAATGFRTVADRTGHWWLAPARAVPVVSQHLAAVHDLSDAGANLAESARSAAHIEIASFRRDDGAFDLDAVRAAAPALAESAGSLDDAVATAAARDVGWLLPPLTSRLDELRSELESNQIAARNAADAATYLPAMLGGDGRRSYFLMFVTPSEAREIGGHMGNWAQVDADKGLLTSTEGRTIELDPEQAADRLLESKDQYPEAYLAYSPDIYPQNLGASPDLPTVARAAASLYPQSGGEPVDGVAVIDPYGIAAFLKLTGPITAPGGPTLDAESAPQFLLLDQYGAFPTDRERVDFLDGFTTRMVDALATSDVSPRQLIDVLAPMVRQHRIRLTTFDPDEVGFLKRTGLATTAVAPPSGDVVELMNSNVGPNKIDALLRRSMEFNIRIDEETGDLDGTIRVTLTNDSDGAGAPYVVANTRNEPPGTNITNLILHTPHQIRSTTIDGSPAGTGVVPEYGLLRATSEMKVPPKGSSTLEWSIVGKVTDPASYSLLIRRHPSVAADDVVVNVSDSEGRPYRLVDSSGDSPEAMGSGGGHRLTLTQDSELVMSAPER